MKRKLKISRKTQIGQDTGKSAKRAAEALLRLLYPNTCPLCGRVTKERVCPDCREAVRPIREPICKKCGKPISSEQAEYCHDCSHTRHYFDEGRALWLHRGGAAWSVYQFKFHNRRIYAWFYASEMARAYGGYVRKKHISLIIPIPLGRRKRRMRGFNQAEILAERLSGMLRIPLDSVHLVRRRDTIPQKSLDPAARRENVRGIFSWTGGTLAGRRVLLVDDIYTTGNTLDSAARTLKKAGAEKVYFLTISIGQGY